MIVLRAAGFGMWLSVIAQIVAGRWMRWAQVDLPVFWRWVGVALIAAAVPFTIWTLKTIGKNITQTVGIRDNHELVTEGPYRWIRHPLYTFGSLIFIGFSLILSSWLTGILALIGFVMLMVRLPQEEANLIDHFGQAYIDYKATTGALLPRLR